MRKTIYIIILAIAALGCSSADAQAQTSKQTGIVAHRGFWNCEEAGYAKNSIAALRCAQEAGFWGSEFDVNMTSDGILLVYHDSDVEGKKIEEHPYSEFDRVRCEEQHILRPENLRDCSSTLPAQPEHPSSIS